MTPGGYAGKWLEVDLTKEKIKEVVYSDETLRQYFGGRGLAAKVLWDKVGEKWAELDPLAPESPLTVFTGPMTGIYPGSRICISGKSPVSMGTVGSTAATEMANEMRQAGIDGVTFVGKAEKPVYLMITDEGAELCDASHLWGLDGEKTLIKLNKEVTSELRKRKPNVGLWKEPGMVYIGPAGENLVRNAAVMAKICHAAGYGGYGSLMGSKNLKAVVAKGRGSLPKVDAPEAAKLLWRRTHEILISQSGMRRKGTGFLGYSVGAGNSSEPIRNWQEEWHDEKSYGGPMFETRFWVKKKWADFNCTTNCMKVSCIKSGKWKGDITDMPDYELQAYCGTNFGIFDPAANIHLSALVDKLGHSGINGPNTAAFAVELHQRGILTDKDFGFKPEWGNADHFDRILRMMASREGIGDILAEGTYLAAHRIAELKGRKPEELLKYAVHVKGIEIGAHGTRSDKDYTHDISYAASVQGGDHTSTASDGYSDMSGAVFTDSGVFCDFTYDGVPQEMVFDFAKAITGFDINLHQWRSETGPRIVTLQKALLLLGGPGLVWEPLKDDDNPPRFYEPLPTGPYKGKTTDRKMVDMKLQAYFDTLGWDKRGIPTKETLQKLDLAFLERSMAKLR
ncbi:aldehyde ferredoxin oxidoreductase [Candidatus Bathyarchaeota archaeon]|jgi:aldehyde:ferredoxin oxidoreductase|nr:aldehyde ferredoxin oxidoreductase [Candidatus Bathyarchaeota archaeon]